MTTEKEFVVWLLEPEKNIESKMTVNASNPIWEDVLYMSIPLIPGWYMLCRRPGSGLDHNKLASSLVPGNIEGCSIVYCKQRDNFMNIPEKYKYAYLNQQIATKNKYLKSNSIC